VEGRRLSECFPYLACRLRKNVVTLAVTGNTISRRIFRNCRVTVFRWQQPPLTGPRWDIRLVSYSGRTPTFCVFPVFRVLIAVMKSVVTLVVIGNNISGRVFRCYTVTVIQRHRLQLTGSRRDKRWVSYSGRTPTYCEFPVFGVAVMEKCCDACGDGE
jgi:hypothetical protein